MTTVIVRNQAETKLKQLKREYKEKHGRVISYESIIAEAIDKINIESL